MRTRLIFSLGLAVLAAAPVMAADAPRLPSFFPLDPPPAAAEDKRGVYVGILGGFARGGGMSPGFARYGLDAGLGFCTCVTGDVLDVSIRGSSYNEDTGAFSGRFGGLVAGYDYSVGNRLFVGAELAYLFSGIKGEAHASETVERGIRLSTSITDIVLVEEVALDTHLAFEIGNIAMARTRVGFELGRFAPYLTAGIATARVSTESSALRNTSSDVWVAGAGALASTWQTYENGGTISNPTLTDTTTDDAQAQSSARHLGWTVGAGLEFLINDRLSLRAEYAFIKLAGATHRLADVQEPTGREFTISPRLQVLGAGLTYRFGQ